MSKVQVAAEQLIPLVGWVQLTKAEPALATAVSVPTSLFPGERVHVVVQVKFSAEFVVSERVTEPLPVPANVMVRFLAA
jgi:hypothetical protein